MPFTLVNIDVKPECIDDFIKITLYNCENSRKEEGNISFDLIRQKEDPTKFILCEHFRDAAAIDFHKTTEHYKKWAETVEAYQSAKRTKVVCEYIQ